MVDPEWFSTSSSLFKPGRQWSEVARYAEPLRRLLTRRYGWIALVDREDLVHDILLEIKEKLAGQHDPGKGRFRALLQTVVRRRVVDLVRRSPPKRLETGFGHVDELPSEALDALELEGSLVKAVATSCAWFAQGPHKDHDVLYALVDRLVHGKSNLEIARDNKISRHRVARLMRRGRHVIFQQLLSEEMAMPAGHPHLEPLLSAFTQILHKPRERKQVLDQLPAELREPLEQFWERFQATLPRFQGADSVAGQELARGIEMLLDDPEVAGEYKAAVEREE